MEYNGVRWSKKLATIRAMMPMNKTKGMSPLWERFPRHLSNQGTHDELLKFGEG